MPDLENIMYGALVLMGIYCVIFGLIHFIK